MNVQLILIVLHPRDMCNGSGKYDLANIQGLWRCGQRLRPTRMSKVTNHGATASKHVEARPR